MKTLSSSVGLPPHLQEVYKKIVDHLNKDENYQLVMGISPATKLVIAAVPIVNSHHRNILFYEFQTSESPIIRISENGTVISFIAPPGRTVEDVKFTDNYVEDALVDFSLQLLGLQ